MTPEQRAELGLRGRNHVLVNYGYDVFCKQWVDLVNKIIEERGAWEDRKQYRSWHFKEIAA